MKLWAMPCRATQDGRVMMESSDKTWSTGEGTGKPLKYSCLENPMYSMKSQNTVADVTGDGRKVWCCKEQCCIGIWNFKSLYQGKLEVVKQEMARVNINILGISELKWTGMGEFNSDAHYIYYSGQESLRRNGVAIIVNKRVYYAVLGCSLKNDWSLFVSKANHSISQ